LADRVSTVLGIGGAKRNACAAICVDGQIRAACEQERLTRVRGIGLAPGGLPREAVDEVIARAGCRPGDVTTYVAAEPQVGLPGLGAHTVDHHQGHAATAFLSSPFHRAAVLVCDTDCARELSVWIGHGSRVDDQNWPWRGRAFASLYAECTELFDFARGQAHRLEALAHLARGDRAEELATTFQYVDGALEVHADWRAHIDRMIQADRRQHGHAAETASAVQCRIGELLLEFLADVQAAIDVDALCLAGGLFYNTYFNTLVRASGLFSESFVPINPGNAGLAVGASLMIANHDGVQSRTTVSPFLGPEYDMEEIKATLDSCKLSYEFVTEAEAQDAAVAALVRGHLVGWYQGRMEWGHRALGHRSILANPRGEYVLDNLNFFLRKRERSRPFGLSVCEDAVHDLFCGPTSSPSMEYEYRPRDDRFRHVIPTGASTIRVQTVPRDHGSFWALLRKMEQASGACALINTSFNGFHEPIVCNPSDAVRVFFGTGLDMLVIGRFVLTK
jgi:carbamoyltransferase